MGPFPHPRPYSGGAGLDLTAFSDVFLNTALKVTGQRVASARPGTDHHTLATSALHKLRLEACRRTGNLGVQHARAVFPNY